MTLIKNYLTSDFIFYSDPSHAWLRVPNKLIIDLKIADKITKYSYLTTNFVYLEEDQDLTLLINELKKQNQSLDIDLIQEKTTDHESHIRSYQPFDKDQFYKNWLGVI